MSLSHTLLNLRVWIQHWTGQLLIAAISLGAAIALAASPAFSRLPSLQVHPLPSTLATWSDFQSSGDYFDQVKQVPVGYLVWSQFPITVYIQPLTPEEAANPFTTKRAKGWINAVAQAVQEWNPYLPLKVVDQLEGVDITVWRSPPPLRLDPAAATPTGAIQEGRPTLSLSRARSAETRFEFYAKPISHPSALSPQPSALIPDSNLQPPTSPTLLTQRFTIHLRPDQAPSYLQAAARHELGHALGIWGHSPIETDVMYFSQVRNPPPISPRDLNTLKRIYAQPTRVGWLCPANECS